MKIKADSRRLFFAIWPSAKIRERLETCRMLHCARGGRWVTPDNLHVTLVFLGQVEVERIPPIEKAVSAIEARAFELRLDWIRPGPSKGMVWLSQRTVPEALSELVASLNEAMSALDFKTEKRRFQPHVTLIRKKPGVIELCEIEAVRWPVRSFALVESSQSRRGSVYTLSRIWELRG